MVDGFWKFMCALVSYWYPQSDFNDSLVIGILFVVYTADFPSLVKLLLQFL